MLARAHTSTRNPRITAEYIELGQKSQYERKF
jgi:hypothetical protein